MNCQIENVVLNCQTVMHIGELIQRTITFTSNTKTTMGKRWYWPIWAEFTQLLVDYYPGFIEVDKLHGTKSKWIIMHCKAQFACYGIPDTLVSDNGPQFSSETFTQFSKDYQFKHRTSSPHYPQPNGMTEKAVQTANSRRLHMTTGSFETPH